MPSSTYDPRPVPDGARSARAPAWPAAAPAGARSAGRRDREGGVALLLALLVLTLFITIVTQLAWTAMVEARLARNSRDDLKIELAARGSVAYAKAYLRADRNDPETGKLDSKRERWAEALSQQITVGDVSVDLEVLDCESRLNVNLLTQAALKPFVAAALKRLVARIGYEAEDGDAIVDRIVDYVDTDDEGDYEEGAKNGPLLGPDELLQIPDIPPDLWFGTEPASDQGALSELADVILGASGEEEAPRPGLLRFLTAWGSSKININTAELDLIYALLPEADANGQPIDRDVVIVAIEEFRTGGTAEAPAAPPAEGEAPPGNDFTSIGDFAQIPGLQNIFPRQGGGAGGAGGGAGGGGAPGGGGGGAPGGGGAGGGTSLGGIPRDLLTVRSDDFTISITATRGFLSRRFEAQLRRGQEEFYVLLWRELQP